MKVLASLLTIFLTLGLFEALLLFGLNHPKFVRQNLPSNALLHLKYLYMNYDREILQYEPGKGRWDPKLFYTLEPGQFSFKNREFTSEYFVNSRGLRDSEDKLVSPEIIVLGDSVAMGWGVEQGENFPALIEKALGQKVLNAAVASYGTAREFTLLKQLDTTKLRTVILQYSDNDVYENAAFVAAGFKYLPSEKPVYENARRTSLENRRYYFGRYSLITLREIGKKVAWYLGLYQPEKFKLYGAEEEANILRKVIQHFQSQGFAKIKIIIVAFNDHADHFSNSSDKILTAFEKFGLKNVQVIYSNQKLDSCESFFLLDGHLTALGHETVAHLIAPLIKSAWSATR
jgi:hypothetical protein